MVNQQHHINNNNNNDDDDDSTVLTTSVDTTTTTSTIATTTITNEVEVVVEQTTNDDGGTNNNTNEHAEEEKVPLPSPDISVVTTSHNNDASPNEDVVVVVDTNETPSSSTTENESQDDTSQQQAVLIKEKPRASPRLSIFSNLFTNNNNNNNNNKNANHNDIANRSNSLPTTNNSNNNNNNNNSNNNNYRFSAVFSRGNNNNIHRGSLPALPSNYHVHGDANNAKTVRKSFFSTQKSFKKQQQQQQQQQSSISDDVALASALIDDFDEQNKVNHMDQQQQSTTESVMERDGNDVHVCIGSRTLPQLKHILKTDQKFGYLTVDQFLEFGLRYGFSHESFIVIFTTTYKTFMTARQVIPRLQFVLDRLVQQQKTKQEEELSLHNRLSSDSSSNDDDEKNNDGEDEKNEAKMTAVNSEEQQNRLIVLGKEKQNRMIQRVSLFVQKWIIDCQTDLMFDRNMIGDLYSFIGGLGSYVCTIDEGEEAIDAETSSTLFTQNIVFDLAEVSGKILTKFQQQNAASSVGNGVDSGDSFGSSGGGLSVGSLGDSSMMGMVSNSGVGMGDGMDDSLSAQERYEELMKSAPKPYYLSREPKDARLINILDLNPIEIARQLTISEFAIFQKITGEELLALGWNKSSKEWTAPNISEIISRSNMMTDWVATLILRVENIKERAKLLKHFINVADACLKINNFNTLFEIMMALISNPVHRLKKTWEAIGAPDRMKFKKLEDVCSFSSNRKNYREELKKVSPTQSCLPYLGVSLTDLVFFDEGNKSTKKTTEKDANVTVNNTGEGTPREITDDIVRSYINFTKKSSMAGVVRGLMNFKSRPYALTPVPYMQLFLYYSMNSNIISSEEELDRLSNLREEPRRGASSKVS